MAWLKGLIVHHQLRSLLDVGAGRLWRAFQFIRTGGKGYKLGKRDGLRYSYSVYNSYAQIDGACKDVFVMNTAGKDVNPYRTCPHVALFARK